MRETLSYFREVLRRKKPYKWFLWIFFVGFLIFFIFVTPSSYGWVSSDLNASISTWASLFASLFAGLLVIVFVEAISLEKELGPMKKLWPFTDHFIRDSDRKLKITVAAIPVDGVSFDRAPGAGEAMAMSHTMRLLMELGMSKAQIDLSYAKRDKAGDDWNEFMAIASDRIVLGGPVYCPVVELFLQKRTGDLRFKQVAGQWRIFFQNEDLTSDAQARTIDYGLILWYKVYESHWWIFLAGLGTHGVIAAGEAITTKRYVQQILEDPKVKGNFSNLAVLVKCTCVGEFIVDKLEVKDVFRFA